MKHTTAVAIAALALSAICLSGCPRQQAMPPPPLPPAASPAFPMQVTDATGASATLSQPPQRIISLAPSLTEILFALGLGDRVVGVTTFCKYPPEALKKEKVGGYINASHEKIVSLLPDVVFCTRGTPRSFMDRVRKAGIVTIAVDQTTFSDVTGSIEEIGRVCGVVEKGQEVANRLRDAMQEVSAKTASLRADQRPRALLVLSLDPLFAAGPGNFQHEMLEACGARNVSALQQPFGALSEEAVVQVDPQVIVFPSNDSGVTVTQESQMKRLRASAAWRNVTAVKNGRVIVINVDYLSIPGPRLELGLRELARELHRELLTQ